MPSRPHTALDLLAADEQRSARVALTQSRGGAPALAVTQKGAIAPFDRIGGTSMGAAEKLGRAYEQSAWVMRAIQLQVAEVATAPLKFYDGDREYSDTRLADWWERPFLGPGGKRIAQSEGREILATWLVLEGEYFIILPPEWAVSFPEVRGTALPPLIIARPARMRHVVQRGVLLGWEWTDGAGGRHALAPEQVLHRAMLNPYDDFRGLSPVKAVLNAAEADYLAGVYVRNLMRNNGDQGCYIIAKGGMPTDEQRDQVIATLREKRAARIRGEFRPTFLNGDITIEDAKAQAPDANLQATRVASRHEIFIGLGVPASMADIKASYSIGSASDRYQLITGTCIPLSRRIDGPLGELASRQAGRVLTAEADWDDHPVMAEVRVERLKAADGLWAKGMPMAQVNDYLDLGLPEYPGWKVGYLPFGVMPTTEDADAGGGASPAADPAQDPALGEDSDPVQQAIAAVRARATQRRPVCARAPATDVARFACACGASEGGAVEQRARDPREVARWREQMRQRREIAAAYESRVNRELYKARTEVLRNIEARQKTTPAGTVQRAAAADLIFDLRKFRDALVASLRRQSLIALETAGQQLYEEIQRDDPFRFPPAEVLEFTRARENKISGAAEDVHRRITESLEEGITSGDTTEELAARIKGQFNAISDGRARVIATTETSAAYGSGRQVAMATAGIRWKQWLTSGNANVRASHAATNQQTVPVDDPYEVPPGSGVFLMHPGDSDGPPEEVINCHCVSIPVAGPDES